VLAQMMEGFGYAFGFAPVRDLLLLVVAMTIFGNAYNTLLPVFARTVFGGDAGTYGLLLAATGLGAVISSLHLASRTTVLGLGSVIARSMLGFSAALFLFGATRSVPLALGLQVLAGMTGIRVFVATNTIIQTLVEDQLRGRVMSLMGMVFMGAMPLGGLLYGKLADWRGAPFAAMAGACVCLAAGLAFRMRLPALRDAARPVYEARGILPPPEVPVFPRP
jgi:MFS family permease